MLKRLKGICRVLIMSMRYGPEMHWPKPEEMLQKYDYHKITYHGKSLAGFRIKYKLTIDTEPEIPVLPHIKIQLIRKSELDALCKAVNEAFLQWMKETNRYFFIKTSQRINIMHQMADGQISDEIICSNTIKEFRKKSVIMFGCRARLFRLDTWMELDDEEENYLMVDSELEKSLRGRIEGMKVEENYVILLAKEIEKSERKWNHKLHFVNNRIHEGKLLKVTTESRDNEFVIKWRFNDSENNRFHLRGFRREGSFSMDKNDSTQGVLFIDHWGDDFAAERLEFGKSYFYTFKVSCLDKSADNPKLESETELEVFRFQIASPPVCSMDVFQRKISAWIEKVQALETVPISVSPERKKINQLVEYLDSYVEFDDALTQREKVLIKEMEGKNYSPKERKDKIERLKLVVEELRQQHS